MCTHMAERMDGCDSFLKLSFIKTLSQSVEEEPIASSLSESPHLLILLSL